HKYAGYRGGPFCWVLGRFVVPIARLPEFEHAANSHLPKGTKDPWRLTGLAGADLKADLTHLEEFNRQFAGRAVIDTVAMRTDSPDHIHRLAKRFSQTVTAYFELALDPDPDPLIRAVSSAGARAKVRTGGLAPAAIPVVEDLARFLVGCAQADVGFKAT